MKRRRITVLLTNKHLNWKSLLSTYTEYTQLSLGILKKGVVIYLVHVVSHR